MQPKLSLLDKNLMERIISEAFDVLQKVGVQVENRQALQLLSEAGCNTARGRTFISQQVIERALKSTPSKIQIFDRYGDPAMNLAGDSIHFDPGSAALTILDWETQRERKPVTQDLIHLARLTDALPNFAAQSTGLISADVPQEIADRYRLFIALQHSSKPVITGTFAVEGFAVMCDMLIAIRGSTQALREKPLAIFDCCPSPPLKWSNLTCQALIDCSRAGIPAEFVSMPLTGGTSPATLAGALVQHTAETLSGIVIGQLANPGAPLIYGGSPAAMDMRTGTTPMGAIETMMIDSAYAQIGKFWGLPTHAYMGLSDAKVLDVQAGLESGMGAMMAALSGINLISGPGMLDFESCQCLEKLVVDHEICGMAMRLVRGIQPREEKLAADLFGAIEEGDHFLTSETTLKWFREEISFPNEVIDRDNYEARGLKGEITAGERAHRRVQEILANHQPKALDENLRRELERIIVADSKKHGMIALPKNVK
jgi:trimethylamine--corrinoid protein Co-methyltransferase